MKRKDADDVENDEIEIPKQYDDEDEAYVAETSGEWQEDEFISIEDGPGDEDEESTYDPYEEDEY